MESDCEPSSSFMERTSQEAPRVPAECIHKSPATAGTAGPFLAITEDTTKPKRNKSTTRRQDTMKAPDNLNQYDLTYLLDELQLKPRVHSAFKALALRHLLCLPPGTSAQETTLLFLKSYGPQLWPGSKREHLTVASAHRGNEKRGKGLVFMRDGTQRSVDEKVKSRGMVLELSKDEEMLKSRIESLMCAVFAALKREAGKEGGVCGGEIEARKLLRDVVGGDDVDDLGDEKKFEDNTAAVLGAGTEGERNGMHKIAAVEQVVGSKDRHGAKLESVDIKVESV